MHKLEHKFLMPVGSDFRNYGWEFLSEDAPTCDMAVNVERDGELLSTGIRQKLEPNPAKIVCCEVQIGLPSPSNLNLSPLSLKFHVFVTSSRIS